MDLAYTEIRAPVAGRVGRSAYSVGDLIKPDGAPLAPLVTLNPLYVCWEASENLLLPYRRQIPDLVRRGQAAIRAMPRLRFEDGSAYPHEGKVDFIDNRINRETSTQHLQSSQNATPKPTARTRLFCCDWQWIFCISIMRCFKFRPIQKICNWKRLMMGPMEITT